jgi:hypothetical protein
MQQLDLFYYDLEFLQWQTVKMLEEDPSIGHRTAIQKLSEC